MSEGVVKSPMTAGEDELRGVLGRNAAELVSAASPGVAFVLTADIVLGRSSSVGQVRARRVCSSLSIAGSGMPADCGMHGGASLINR